MKRIPKTQKPPVSVLEHILSSEIIGQDHVLEKIPPVLDLYTSGLNPEGRPAGVFLLMGPTGTGKTATVEAVAKAVHGDAKNVLRIDCGEFQSEHEIAKLVGAPPGYLGHRETQPFLTQSKINQVMSDRANLAIILFDEIEKAAPSFQRLLLGILDKGRLRLGDGNPVQFERTLIFMTSNLGAKELARELRPSLGFDTAAGPKTQVTDLARFDELGKAAAKKHFSPEFIGRVDEILTFRPLTPEGIEKILDLQLQNLANHISRRLGERRCYLRVPKATRKYLIAEGFSPESGARQLKHVLTTQILQPLARLLVKGVVEPGAIVECGFRNGKVELRVEQEEVQSVTA